MKKTITSALLALLFIVSSSAFGADKILPYPIYQHRLDNGLNVVTVPFDSPGLVSFHIVTRVGARN